MGQEINHKDNLRRELSRISFQRFKENRGNERVSFSLINSLKRTILMYLAVQIPEK